MKILLILPRSQEKLTSLGKFCAKISLSGEPLGIPIIEAVTPERHDVTILDETFEKIDFSISYDLVGISCVTQTASRAYEIADYFKEEGIPVVLGGHHPTALPKEAKEHADSIVIGEGEISWPRLLKDFERGHLHPFYSSKFIDPNKIPILKRKFTRTPFIASVQTSRGCPYNCEFCSNPVTEGRKFRPRPIKDVMEEITALNCKYLLFIDNSFTIDTIHTKNLFREMKKLNKKFGCFGNINVLERDEELLTLAHEAGCLIWFVGFESINQKTIDYIGKKCNIVNKYDSVIQKLKDYGFAIIGSFMFGFDTDSLEVFDDTLKAVEEWQLECAEFNILIPYPGTPLFSRLESEGRILTRDWSQYKQGNVVFQPKQMTAEELFEGMKNLHKKFYRPNNMVKRFLRALPYGFNSFLATTSYNYLTKRFYKIIYEL